MESEKGLLHVPVVVGYDSEDISLKAQVGGLFKTWGLGPLREGGEERERAHLIRAGYKYISNYISLH